jgi:hypothetical protein
MPGAVSADAAGNHFASFFDERLQGFQVLVIYRPVFVSAKTAKSFA